MLFDTLSIPTNGQVFLVEHELGVRIMCRNRHVNFENLPWPANVLKFNQLVGEMQTGDDMVVTIKDVDVVGNLQLLLGSLPDLQFEILRTASDYRIRVIKR